MEDRIGFKAWVLYGNSDKIEQESMIIQMTDMAYADHFIVYTPSIHSSYHDSKRWASSLCLYKYHSYSSQALGQLRLVHAHRTAIDASRGIRNACRIHSRPI